MKRAPPEDHEPDNGGPMFAAQSWQEKRGLPTIGEVMNDLRPIKGRDGPGGQTEREAHFDGSTIDPAQAKRVEAALDAKHAAQVAKFDGATYDPAQDNARLSKQLVSVRQLMLDGAWRTLAEIAHDVGAPEASVSARLRDLRKPKFGGWKVEHDRVSGGTWRYRVKP